MRRTITTALLLTLLAGCAACAPASRATAPEQAAAAKQRVLLPPSSGGLPAPSGRVVFDDDFDGPLDTSVWRPYHSTYGDGNHELQCHTPANVVTFAGTLAFTARRERVTCPNGSTRDFSSGFVGTRETGHWFPLYGRYEVRARVPHGQGLWPAFWLRHRNGAGVAEVDVMEYFHATSPGSTTATLHLDGRKNLSKANAFIEQPTSDGGWHTWAVDISPDPSGVRFTFALDGRDYHSYVDTQHRWADGVDPNATWDIALNLSVGGDYVGHPDGELGVLGTGRCGRPWGSAPPCRTTDVRRADLPAIYAIDEVRVTVD